MHVYGWKDLQKEVSCMEEDRDGGAREIWTHELYGRLVSFLNSNR